MSQLLLVELSHVVPLQLELAVLCLELIYLLAEFGNKDTNHVTVDHVLGSLTLCHRHRWVLGSRELLHDTKLSLVKLLSNLHGFLTRFEQLALVVNCLLLQALSLLFEVSP